MEFVDLQRQAADCLAEDNYGEAIALYEQCIAANPNEMSNYWKLGLCWLLQEEEVEASACWFSAIVEGSTEQIEEWTAELIEVLETEGLQRLKLGKYEQVERIYLQVIEQNPNSGKAYKNLGNAVLNQGKLEAAIAYYQQGLSLEPDDALAYYHLALAYHQQDKLEEAIACYQKFLAVNPNSAVALNNLGNALQRQEKLEEAIAYYQQALRLNPNDALTYNNLGSAYKTQGKLEEALVCYQEGLRLQPDNAEAHQNLGLFLQDRGQFQEALACFDRAIEIAPNYVEANWSRALLRLKLGDYQRGFAEYEWRWRRESNPPRAFDQPLWNGSNLAGKTILLHAEQGLGDTIQFIRYIPLVIQRGGRVVVECHKPLVRLLTAVTGIEQVVAIGTTLPEFDVYAPLLSLPRIFGTTLETIPIPIPYLSPLESHDFALETPAKAALKVGIVWAGNPENPSDYKRSCSLTHFLTLFHTPDIAFYSLQKEPKAAELEQLSGKVPLQDLSSQLNDFADTAAAIAQIDLIITVDTAVAHLAGALGRPVWVLLCFNCDWRWMISREDSPWYPTMRLFRQNQPGDWEGVLDRVQAALQELMNSTFHT